MSTGARNRDEALQLIAQTAREYSLSLKDIRQALEPKKGGGSKEPAPPRGEIVLRLLMYLGSLFVFAGLAAYFHMVWGDLSSLSRVIVSLGTGFVAYLLGVAFAKNPQLTKLAKPAFLIAFVLQPTGLFVFLHEYFSGGNHFLGAMVVFGILSVQQILTFFAIRYTPLLLFSMLYVLGFAGAFIEYLDLPRAFSCLVIGLAYIFITIDLQKREAYKIITPLFYFIGSGLFLSGVYYYIGNTVYDPLYLSLSIALLAVGLKIDSRTLYILAVLHTLTYLLHCPGGGWFSWSSPVYHGWQNELGLTAAGISVILTGLWLRRPEFNVRMTPVWMFLGTSYAMGGLFSLLYNTPLEVAYIGLAAGSVYLSLVLGSRAMLAAAALALIGFIGYFTSRYFADAVGWPIALMLMGAVMIGLSIYVIKLGQKIGSARP